MPSFMAIVAPGLENISAKELKFYSKSLKTLGLEYNNINTIKGGVEFESPMEHGLFANHFLKTPVRILYRWGKFEEVLRTNDIEQAFESLDWFDLLSGFKPEFHVSSFKSKMFHLQKLKQACEMSYRRVKIKQNIKVINNRVAQKVYVRLSKNKMTVSLDTTGELLYKRGLNKAVNAAPLRENVTSALLWWVKSQHPDKFNLLDPMCGSGTILLESQNLFNINSNREYQYQLWKSNGRKFVADHISEVTKQVPKVSPYLKSFGIEVNAKTFETLNANVRTIKNIEVKRADCTKISRKELNIDDNTPLIILTNPPYEKRLHLELSLQKTLEEVQNNFKPDHMYYIYPIDQHKNKKPHISFRSGGLNLGLFS